MKRSYAILLLNIVLTVGFVIVYALQPSGSELPLITRIGAGQVIIPLGAPYIDSGAKAIDSHGNNITSSIITVNPVNSSVSGSYTVTYDLTDSLGNHAKQVTRTVVVVAIPTQTSAPLLNTITTEHPTTAESFDKWGIKELNPTKTNGRVWFSTWDNGISRTINSGNIDPYDPTGWFRVRGNGSGISSPTVYVDGMAVATLSGNQPRMYVYDPTMQEKWLNTEITVYGKRISETNSDSSQGINIGARSNHQDQGQPSNCGVDTYYSRMLYDGVGNFAKELNWPKDAKAPSSIFHLGWSTYGDTMPYKVWIGHKFILRNVDGDTHVKLEMWRDLTDGLNGGDWKLMVSYTDDGNWVVPETPGCSTTELNKIILQANPSIFIRNTDISSAQYKYFSIREIDPLP